ncbi:hypothetical protein [Sulfobacillus harzensis]|uniref:Uncharacterized protein n=1 Tax=Sulfobacillus harzensis TaxID=2729629 RepID=A0A7Y0L7H0_9FIRM|nr:hypothetical protein [Sulfobacillus harzensis]NMP24728.1 hypothetical protein [Sulfobacillus harzensis]
MAIEDDRLRGFVLFNTRTFGEQGYIRLFGVDRLHISSRLGPALLRRVESSVREQSIFRLVLLCAD